MPTEKDVVILAYPRDNQAHLTGKTANGFVFTGSASKDKVITGEEVNETLKELKERGLSFSFRLPELIGAAA